MSGLWRRLAARLLRAHVEFNYRAIAGLVPEGSRVIDIGAWDGRLGALLAERRGCDVLNVDVVDENRAAAPFRLFDGRVVPEADGSRDVVTFMYVLHHSADDARLLAEARRLLAPGGVVLVAEDAVDRWWERAVTVAFHVWLLLFTGMGWRGRFRVREAWRARFAAAGLELLETRPLGPHLGRWWWPRNVVYVLRAARGSVSPSCRAPSP